MTEERAREISTWTMVAATAIAALVGLQLAGFTFVWRSALLPALATSLTAALGVYYRTCRKEEALGATLIAVSQLVAFTTAAVPLSYLLASMGGPLWDVTFLEWDRALGIDWRAYLDFVNDRPTLGLAFALAYQSILPQMILAVAALGLSGRGRDLGIFIGAVVLSGLVTVVISGALPAMAMFVHLGLGQHDYPNLAPVAADVHVAAMNALRSGTMRAISLDGAEGLITFPSYHAALGAIFLLAFWAVPWLRWPAVALNLTMIAATPIDGGHYFVDVLAGIAVAVASVLVVRALGPLPLRAYRYVPELRPASGGTPAASAAS